MSDKKIIEQIVLGQGADAASSITKILNSKLKDAITEQKENTAMDVYGGLED
jgi:hypothetical protein